ncbi:MAG: alpha/beta hydrolase [Lentisphaerae bacterium]|nr:alpha/beta hydrolase [Lentisphaerota bacterium]
MLVLILACASCGPAHGAEHEEQAGETVAVKRRAVVYKRVGWTKLRMFVFEPETEAAAKRPAIVFFFGGGWSTGTPAQFEEQCRHFAARGMVAATVEYRVWKKHGTLPFRAVSDAKSAVRWLRAHAEEYGIDPDRIVAAGGSAGGHLAAATALVEGFEEPGEDICVSSAPDALVLFNPALDTSWERGRPDAPLKVRATSISPVDNVRSNLPPTIVFHGTADTTVPFEQAERFGALMKKAGNVCELHAYEGAEHGFYNFTGFKKTSNTDEYYADVMKKTDDFLVSLGFLAPLAEKESGR